MVFENGVKNIQAEAYNDARTVYKFIMQLFSADAIVFSKKKFEPENMKKLP